MSAPRVFVPGGGGGLASQGKWGSFWDTSIQNAVAPLTDYAIGLNTSDPDNNGVRMVGGSKLTFDYAGVYSVTYSVQFANSSATLYDAQIWLRKNGVTSAANAPDSNSQFSITAKHGTTDGHIIASVNYVFRVAVGDYYQLVWSTESTTVRIETVPAGTTPVSPRTPAVILTAVQIAGSSIV